MIACFVKRCYVAVNKQAVQEPSVVQLNSKYSTHVSWINFNGGVFLAVLNLCLTRFVKVMQAIFQRSFLTVSSNMINIYTV